jgi:opacity protein-like surface antigen
VLAVIAACPLATPAHAVNGLAGIDAMTATVFQKGQSSFSGLALRFRLHDARLLDNVEFLPTVEYWRNSSSLDAFDLHAVRRDATLGADARWMFPGESWRPYLGAGLAVHFLSSEVDFGANHDNDSLTKGGLTLLGGVSFGNKSRIGNFIEVKGHLVGDFRQLKVNMGLSWNH